ncbi:MAG: hypothetical protein ACRD1G_08565, partial [Acidimicrobiales bacterium]
ATHPVREGRGTCHRCGWTDVLTRVDRRLRATLGSARQFRLLCDDCVNDLRVSLDSPRLMARTRAVVTHPLRREAYRSVA